MTNTCIADKPSTALQKLQKSAFTNFFSPVSHGQNENQPSVVSWHAIHDDPESYWSQLLLASISSDSATRARQSLWQDQEVPARTTPRDPE